MKPRVACLMVCFGIFLPAQTPPATDDAKTPAAAPQEAPPPSPDTSVAAPPVAPLLVFPKVCAIPLLNVLRAKTEPMPVIHPPSGTKFFIREIRPPAPACGERKNPAK